MPAVRSRSKGKNWPQQYGHYYYIKLLVANEARLQNAVKRYKQNSRPGTTITRYVHEQA